VDLLNEAEDRLDIAIEAPVPLKRFFLPCILEATRVDECVLPLLLLLLFLLLLTKRITESATEAECPPTTLSVRFSCTEPTSLPMSTSSATSTAPSNWHVPSAAWTLCHCCAEFICSPPPLPPLVQGLASHSSVVWAIMRQCTQLFSMPFPGIAVLIPDFLREIEKLVRPSSFCSFLTLNAALWLTNP